MPETKDPIFEQATLHRRRSAATAAVPEPLTHILLVHQEHAAPKRIVLRPLPFIIGRTPPANLVLDGPTVSRRHCQFELRDGRIVIADLGSTNGTIVNGRRVAAPLRLQDGATIMVGAHALSYERRSQRETDQAQALDRELQEASSYVMSILPPPLDRGPVRAEWFYLPCTKVGGDAFGYQALDTRSFMMFMIDVCGHGTGAALHAVTVANVLRQRLLPGVDFRDPAAIVRNLNHRFKMEQHNGMMFSIWIGVFDIEARMLTFCAAGHHPAYLAPMPPQSLSALTTRNPAIGVVPDHAFVASKVEVPPNSGLYLFSDGVFEIVGEDGRQWGLDDVTPLLHGNPEPQMAKLLYETIRGAARPGPLDDDFSVLVMSLP